MQVLLVDPGRSLPPDFARSIAGGGWTVETINDYRAAADLAQDGRVDAVILPAPRALFNDDGAFDSLLRVLNAQRTAAILVSDDAVGVRAEPGESLVDTVPSSVSPDEVRGRLAMIDRYCGVVRRLVRELTGMQRLGTRLNEHFTEIDQEMRLAARLQHDFLPQDLGPFGAATFATLFRPAQWVSGDIYDVIQVDDSHVAFYVADAIGHGLAAGLLTMFIKKTVGTRRWQRGASDLLDPSETLAALNDALAAQALPHSQFVTACFCALNLDTLDLRYASGGHPYPLLIGRDGLLTELKSHGPLLGLSCGEEFAAREVRLQPGEKVVLFTDGLEVAFRPERFAENPIAYARAVFGPLASLPVSDLVARLDQEINNEAGSLNPRDDLTIVAAEVGGPGG